MDRINGIVFPDYHSTGNRKNENEKTISRRWWLAWAVGNRIVYLKIKKNFKTDGASIPRFLWRICGHPWISPRDIPAIAHDWLYASHLTTRKFADQAYRSLQKRVGIGWIKRNVEYYALRMFGGSAWNGHGPDDENFARSHGAVQVRRKTRKETDKMNKIIVTGLVALAFAGCTSLQEKTFMTDAYGAFANQSGTAGVGKINIMTIPDKQAFIHAEYEEDTAFFSPSTVLHNWRFTWSGGTTTNATDKAAADMIKALAKLATAAKKPATNAVETVSVPAKE